MYELKNIMVIFVAPPQVAATEHPNTPRLRHWFQLDPKARPEIMDTIILLH
jgi:hypothetical protein